MQIKTAADQWQEWRSPLICIIHARLRWSMHSAFQPLNCYVKNILEINIHVLDNRDVDETARLPLRCRQQATVLHDAVWAVATIGYDTVRYDSTCTEKNWESAYLYRTTSQLKLMRNRTWAQLFLIWPCSVAYAICHFLLVNNTNLHPILHRFQLSCSYSLRFSLLGGGTSL